MYSPIEPFSPQRAFEIYEFIFMVAFQLVFMSAACSPVFLIGCIVALFIPPKNKPAYHGRVGRFGLLLITFVVTWVLFNSLWSTYIWSHFYYSTDFLYTDFLPYWPITQGYIDIPFGNEKGYLIGITITQLQLLWLLFAIGTWSFTFVLYPLLRRILTASESYKYVFSHE
ncbi:MAG: hypothetical protein ABIP97_08465 [Chthoniobacterales bacterium]